MCYIRSKALSYEFCVRLSRVCMKDYSVRGATITKGTRVEIPLDFIHHLHSHWENPHSFSPDRYIALHYTILVYSS